MKKKSSKKRPICPRCKTPCDTAKTVKGKFAGVECWQCGYSGKVDTKEFD